MWFWSCDQLERLGGFLAERGLCGPTVTAGAIGDGHSNLTFLVSDGHSRVVVRRPPPPPLPPGAHDVLREARLLAALAGTDVPTPRVLATAAAGELLDVPVFVMDFVDGTVITESTPAPSDDERLRRRIGESLVDTLAALHTVAWREVGLGDFGKPDGFNARQLRRMRSLVEVDGVVPKSFAPLDDWLHAHVPPESATSIVHNDFRIGNMIVDIGDRLRRRGAGLGARHHRRPARRPRIPARVVPGAGRAAGSDFGDGHRGAGAGLSGTGGAARPLRRPHRRRCVGVELVCHAGDVQARRALRVQPQAVRGRGRRPLLRRSGVGDVVPGCRRTAGRRRDST